MTRRRRRTYDPYATALRTTTGTGRIIHAAATGTCPKCLTDYPAGTPIINGRQGWQCAVCDESDF